MVLYKNATVYYYDEEVLRTNMELADYTSQLGDGDSTIIHKTSSVNTLVGVHTGVTCLYNSPTEGLDMITLEEKDSSGQCILTFFTPWESAKDALGFE